MTARDVSSLSSCSTTGSEASVLQASGGSNSNGMTMLRDLYEEMEPQITKSYRPHVVYEPPSKPPTAHQRLRAVLDKRKAKLKATHIMMQAVNEMKRKKDITVSKKREIEKDKSGKSLNATPKEVSQSLPNLANSNS